MFQYNLASEFSMTSFITITIIIKGDDVIGHVTLLTNAILLTVTKLFCYCKSSQRGLKHNGVSHKGGIYNHKKWESGYKCYLALH